VALGLEGLTDVLDRDVLRAEGKDLVAYPVAFGSAVRACLREEEEGALGVGAALVAQDTKTAGRRAPALGHLVGGEALNAGGAERLVGSRGRMRRCEADACRLCTLLLCTVTQKAPWFSERGQPAPCGYFTVVCKSNIRETNTGIGVSVHSNENQGGAKNPSRQRGW
jgi:hypothetical protein